MNSFPSNWYSLANKSLWTVSALFWVPTPSRYFAHFTLGFNSPNPVLSKVEIAVIGLSSEKRLWIAFKAFSGPSGYRPIWPLASGPS